MQQKHSQSLELNFGTKCTENSQHCAVLRRHAWPFGRGTAEGKIGNASTKHGDMICDGTMLRDICIHTLPNNKSKFSE